MNDVKIFQNKNNQVTVLVQFIKDTVWLNRNPPATLFDRDVEAIGKHVNNVSKEDELSKEAVLQILRQLL